MEATASDNAALTAALLCAAEALESLRTQLMAAEAENAELRDAISRRWSGVEA